MSQPTTQPPSQKNPKESSSPKEIASGCMVLVILAGLVIGVLFLVFSVCSGESEEERAERLEDRRKGFHCLSDWDGNHDGLEALVRPLLQDPGSMQTYETLIGPVRDGKHQITMNFGARNAFGGMVRHTAKGEVDHKTCEATLTELY